MISHGPRVQSVEGHHLTFHHALIHTSHAFQSIDQVHCSRHSMAALQPGLSLALSHPCVIMLLLLRQDTTDTVYAGQRSVIEKPEDSHNSSRPLHDMLCPGSYIQPCSRDGDSF